MTLQEFDCYLSMTLQEFDSYLSIFPPFEGLSATFFIHVEAGVVFVFMGIHFWLAPPPPTKISPACPLTLMSNIIMQYNHSLTAVCHFRDILKIVTIIEYFLMYILPGSGLPTLTHMA